MAVSAKTCERVHRYLIALGSNRRHVRHGPPKAVIAAALTQFPACEMTVIAQSRIVHTAPLGPSHRRFANAAATVATRLDPMGLLRTLKGMERSYGRRGGGRKWSARVLDLDIILWSGGPFATPSLTIPHPEFRRRGFVLRPAAEIAPDWRDPSTGLTIRQLSVRLPPFAVDRATSCP